MKEFYCGHCREMRSGVNQVHEHEGKWFCNYCDKGPLLDKPPDPYLLICDHQNRISFYSSGLRIAIYDKETKTVQAATSIEQVGKFLVDLAEAGGALANAMIVENRQAIQELK